MKIYEIATVIERMNPISISINGEEVWTEDYEVPSDRSAAQKAILDNKKQYLDAVSSDLTLKSITFEICDFHHSRVKISAGVAQ